MSDPPTPRLRCRLHRNQEGKARCRTTRARFAHSSGLPAGARRCPGLRRARRDDVPRWDPAHGRRVHGGRRLLRPVRLPHHLAPDRRVAAEPHIRLGAFWARRARRLLPAMLLMLLFVAFFASVIVPRGTYGALRLDALSTLLYVSNWHFILRQFQLLQRDGCLLPLLHTWSLASRSSSTSSGRFVVLGVMHFTKSLRPCSRCAGPRRSLGDLDARALRRRPQHQPGVPRDRHALPVPVHRVRLAVGLVLVTRRSHEEGRLAKASCGDQEPRRDAGVRGDRCRRRGLRGRALGADDLDVVVPLLGRVLPHRPRRRGDHPGLRGRSRSIVPRVLSLAPVRYVAGSPTASTSGTGPSSFGSTTPDRALRLRALRVARPRHLSRCPSCLPPDRAPIRMGTFVSQWRAWLVVPAGVGAVLVAVVAATTDHRGRQHAFPSAIHADTGTSTTASTVPGAAPDGAPVGSSSSRLGGADARDRAVVPPDQAKYGYVLSDKGIPRCGVVDGPVVELMGARDETPPACDGSPLVSGEPLNQQPWPYQWL